MSKKITGWLTTLAAQAALAAFALAPAANAQCPEYLCDPPGTLKCCPGSSATNFIAQGGSVSITATTNGCFIINSCTLPASCGTPGWAIDMTMKDFSGTAVDPTLGTVHWRNDPSMPGSSRITALDAARGDRFPAFGIIRFYAEAEIDGVPGIYRSRQEVIITNRNVMSWDPFVNEVFSTDPGTRIDFVNDVTGDVITLTSLASTLN